MTREKQLWWKAHFLTHAPLRKLIESAYRALSLSLRYFTKTFPFGGEIPTGWKGFVMFGFWYDLDIWIERTAVKYAGKIAFDCMVDSVKQITLLFILLFKPAEFKFRFERQRFVYSDFMKGRFAYATWCVSTVTLALNMSKSLYGSEGIPLQSDVTALHYPFVH